MNDTETSGKPVVVSCAGPGEDDRTDGRWRNWCHRVLGGLRDPPGADRVRTWRLSGFVSGQVGGADGPYAFTPLLDRLEDSGVDAVVVRGSALAREVLLCAWRGWRTAWCRASVPPADLLGRLAAAHADVILDPGPPGEDDERLAARATSALAARPRAADGDRPPPGISTWRRLQEQLALREALDWGDGTRHAAIVRETAEREGAAAARTPSEGEERTLLVLTHEYSWSGAPMVLARVLQGLIEAGTRWRIRVLGRADGPLRAAFDAMGIPAALYGSDDAAGFLDAVARATPDVVLVNTVTMYQEVLLLAWKGLPVHWWIHEGINLLRGEGHTLEIPELREMVRTALAAAATVLFGSEDTRREYERLCPGLAGRDASIPNPIRLDELDAARRAFGRGERISVRRELGVAPGDVLFLCIGGIEVRKNHLRLVAAFQRLRDSLPPEARRCCRLVILGRALRERGRENLQEEILSAIGPAHRGAITLEGNRESVLPVLLAADAHVLVSTTESSPLVNLEAAALGIPCISSAVHGIPEVLADGERGFLADPHGVDSICSTLRRVYDLIASSSPELEAVRARARDFVRERHDHRRAAASLSRHLDACSAAGGPILAGAAADGLLAENLTLTWSVFKAHADVDRHLVRAHAHRGFCRSAALDCLQSDPAPADAGAEPPSALVTGGCGMIGSAVVRALAAWGVRILVVDDLSRGDPAALPQSGAVDFLRGDFGDPAVLERVAAFRAQSVFHFAARCFIPECERDPEGAWRVNVEATRRLFDAVAGHPPREVVFASSGAVYAPSPRPHRERDPTGPIDVYGRTKLAAEQVVLQACARMGAGAVVARIFNTYGPRSGNPFLVENVVRQLASGTRSLRLGNVEAVRDLCFVDDVAEALLMLAPLACDEGIVVNVGAGRRESIAEIVAAVSTVLGERVELIVDPTLLRPVDRPALLCDPELLRRLTGWAPRHDLAAGLGAVLAARGVAQARISRVLRCS